MDWEMEMEMKHSLHNEYRSINKNKILNKKKTLRIGMVDKLVVMLAVEGSFVELGDGAEGGFVKLRDEAKGGDVGGKAERVRVSDWERVRVSD